MNTIHSTLTVGILAHRSLVQRSPTLVGADLALFSGWGRIRREISSAVLSRSREKEGSQEDETRSARHDEAGKEMWLVNSEETPAPPTTASVQRLMHCEPNTRDRCQINARCWPNVDNDRILGGKPNREIFNQTLSDQVTIPLTNATSSTIRMSAESPSADIEDLLSLSLQITVTSLPSLLKTNACAVT
jgi:hypothetical protein